MAAQIYDRSDRGRVPRRREAVDGRVFAAARRKTPHVSLVDFGLDDIEIGDSVQVTGVARASSKKDARVEIRGTRRVTLTRIEYAHPLALEDALRPSKAKEERYDPRRVVPDLLHMETLMPQVATEMYLFFAGSPADLRVRKRRPGRGGSGRYCSFTKLREEGSNF